MTKFNFLLISVLLISALGVQAQRKKTEANLVLTDQTKVSGTLKFGDWENNPDKILFKASTQTSYTTYTPNDISSFSTSESTYISALVTLDKASNRLEDLQKDIVYDTLQQQVFLKQLVVGPISLYQFNNANGTTNFFLKTADGEFHRLTYKRFMNDDSQLEEKNTFRNELNYFLQDCKKVIPSLNTVAYKANSLSNAMIAYARCKGKVIKIKEPEKPKKSLAIYAGVGYGNMKSKGMETLLINGVHFKPTLNPAFLISAGFPIASRFQKHQMQLEAGTKQLRISGIDSFAYNYYVGHLHSIDMNYIFAKLNLLYRYHFIKTEQLKVFGELGACFMFALQAKLEIKDLSTNKTYPNAKPFRKTEEALIGGLGLQVGRISALARYEYGTGLSSFSAIKTSSQTGSLFVGYQLFK